MEEMKKKLGRKVKGHRKTSTRKTGKYFRILTTRGSPFINHYYFFVVLTDLLDAMHTLREKYGIKSHCHCTNKQNIQVGNFPAMNGVSQVSTAI